MKQQAYSAILLSSSVNRAAFSVLNAAVFLPLSLMLGLPLQRCCC